MSCYVSNQTVHLQEDGSIYRYGTALFSFFWVNSRRLNFMCRRFGTLSFNFTGGTGFFLLTPHMKMKQRSETSAHIMYTKGIHSKERIQHSQHG